ncbi:MAG: tail fiber domain-containing protein, partial [Candidatus Paceibacterota bacterium]
MLKKSEKKKFIFRIFNNKSLFVSLSIFAIFYGALVVFAVPPATPYLPSDSMLDPTCAPGSSNCTVNVLAIGNSVSSATAGSVLFAGTSGILAQDNSNLFWDDTNNKLGIGTSSPSSALTIDSGDFATGENGINLQITGLAHGVTAKAPTDVAAVYEPYDSSGGLYALGIRTENSIPAFLFDGVLTSGSSSVPVMEFLASVSDGGTGVTFVSDTHMSFQFVNYTNSLMTILGSGNIGLTGITAPTARLHFPAGTATAGTAPLKFTSGTNLTTAEAGAIEWNGTNLFITQTAGPTRKTIAYTSDIVSGWGLTGNAGTVDGTNFIGTTDDIALNFRVSDDKAGRIDYDIAIANTFFGYQVGNSNTTGYLNTAIGYQSLYSNTEGYNNNALGYQALYSNTTGDGNLALGDSALYTNDEGDDNIAIGAGALFTNSSGTRNIANGFQALYSSSNGNDNVAFGYRSLYSNITGNKNVAIGNYALFTQSFSNGGTVWDSDNVAVGYQALYSNQPDATSSGIENTALGNYALYSNTTGSANVALGLSSLFSVTTGGSNTAIGYMALASNTTGNENVALGYEAGRNSGQNGSYNGNILIGYSTADGIDDGADNNILIGYNLDLQTANGDGQLSIGNLIFGTGLGATGATVSTGSVGIGVAVPGAKLDVQTDSASGYVAKFFNDGNNVNRYGILIQAGEDTPGASDNIFIQFNDGDGTDLGSYCYSGGGLGACSPSDERLKENISDTLVGLNDLMQIQVRDFSFISDENHNMIHGFIAQELYEAYPDAVIVPSDPDKYWKIMTSQLTPLIVESIQEMNLKINEINNFEKENDWRDSLIAWFGNIGNQIE